MERKFAGKIFRKFRYTSRGCPLSLEALFSIIQSAWNSSVNADELSEFHKRYLNARRSDVKGERRAKTQFLTSRSYEST